MRVVVEGDLSAYLDAVRDWLSRDPVRHNVVLTVMQSRADGVEPIEEDILLAQVMDGSEIAGVAIRTPPHALLVSDMAEPAVAALADYLVAHEPDVWAASGTSTVAAPLAEAIAAARGGTVHRTRAFGRYRLTRLVPPRPAPGIHRQAGPADVDLIVRWAHAFQDDTGLAEPVNPDKIRARVALGQMWLWEDGGEPVCMANRSEPVGAVARVNLVYTPKALRGRGYATNLVAAVTHSILAAGLMASLYTDLSNPTSNKIYQALGYEKVDEAGIWTVTP